jgi:RNA polymerase sigma-70 factor, ECF subfamily
LTQYTTYTDEQLLQLLANSDELAFKEIYYRHSDRLSANAIKLTGSYDDANDIVQELFINLWNKRNELRISSLSAYLDTSIRYASFRILKNTSHKNAQLISLKNFLENHEHQPDIHTKQLEEKITRIIEMMPARTKEVYTLSRHEQLSHKEISEQLNIAEDTSRQHIKNALCIIRHQLNILSSFF